VLLDLRMPELDGIGVLRRLGERIARFPVVIITGHGEVEVAIQAMKAGAADFIEKPFSDSTLVQMLRPLLDGLPAQAQAAREREDAVARLASLTNRERELVDGLASGLSNKRAAEQMGISVRTVEVHRSNLMKRLGIGSVAELVRLAILAKSDGA
jgi:two-component system response regulator FixJ